MVLIDTHICFGYSAKRQADARRKGRDQRK